LHVNVAVKMDPDNAEIKKDTERSRKKLVTLVKKQETLLRGVQHQRCTYAHVLHIYCTHMYALWMFITMYFVLFSCVLLVAEHC